MKKTIKMKLVLCAILSGCASVKVTKLSENTYQLVCKESTDACQQKAWELCGGDFDTLSENFKEDTTVSYSHNPHRPGDLGLMSQNVDVTNDIKIRCVTNPK